jgi:hypothetical protein
MKNSAVGLVPIEAIFVGITKWSGDFTVQFAPINRKI